MNQEEADAIAQLLALREKWAEVSTIKEKWEANKVYCVAPPRMYGCPSTCL